MQLLRDYSGWDCCLRNAAASNSVKYLFFKTRSRLTYSALLADPVTYIMYQYDSNLLNPIGLLRQSGYLTLPPYFLLRQFGSTSPFWQYKPASHL